MSQVEKSNLPIDAFSSGQVGSKIWLCEELEKVAQLRAEEVIWIYGGWVGVMGFTLLARNNESGHPKIKIKAVRSFDIDPAATDQANIVCENWVWRQWKFRAFTQDCNLLNPQASSSFGEPPTMIINTSAEHFKSRDWFDKILPGTMVALQASDFDHHGAVALFSSAEALAKTYPLRDSIFSGSLRFEYENWGFNRWMHIGIK